MLLKMKFEDYGGLYMSITTSVLGLPQKEEGGRRTGG
jgi:hypothetical protein